MSKPKSKAITEPPPKPAYLALTENGIKQALLDAGGDLFVASQLLEITALRLERCIRTSAALQVAHDEILKANAHGEPYAKRSLDNLNEAIQHRLSLYRVVGLDSLAELATMPLDANSAQNQVRLAAAARLAGEAQPTIGGDSLADTLRLLNEQYHQQAPRIRVVRERMMVEMTPASEILANSLPDESTAST